MSLLNTAICFNIESNFLEFKFAKDKRFSFEQLNLLSSFQEQSEYLNKLGIIALEDIGSGRLVYILSSKKALKLAKNEMGIAQNQAEVENLIKHKSKFLPKIYDYASNYSWILVELVRPLTSAKELVEILQLPFRLINLIFVTLKKSSSFQEYLDNELKNFVSSAKKGNHWYDDLVDYCESSTFEGIKQCLLNNRTLVDFFNFILKTNLAMNEIHWQNLGKNSNGELVILDLGGTKEIMKKYYL